MNSAHTQGVGLRQSTTLFASKSPTSPNVYMFGFVGQVEAKKPQKIRKIPEFFKGRELSYLLAYASQPACIPINE